MPKHSGLTTTEQRRGHSLALPERLIQHPQHRVQEIRQHTALAGLHLGLQGHARQQAGGLGELVEPGVVQPGPEQVVIALGARRALAGEGVGADMEHRAAYRAVLLEGVGVELDADRVAYPQFADVLGADFGLHFQGGVQGDEGEQRFGLFEHGANGAFTDLEHDAVFGGLQGDQAGAQAGLLELVDHFVPLLPGFGELGEAFLAPGFGEIGLFGFSGGDFAGEFGGFVAGELVVALHFEALFFGVQALGPGAKLAGFEFGVHGFQLFEGLEPAGKGGLVLAVGFLPGPQFLDGFVELAHPGGEAGLALGQQLLLEALLGAAFAGPVGVPAGACHAEFLLKPVGLQIEGVVPGVELAGVGLGEGGVQGGEGLALMHHLADSYVQGFEDAGLQGLDDEVGQRRHEPPRAHHEAVHLGQGSPDQRHQEHEHQGVEGDPVVMRGAVLLQGICGGKEVGQALAQGVFGGHGQRCWVCCCHRWA